VQVKVCVLGHFGEGMNLLNGQTVKTKIITEELCQRLGKGQVLKIDTHGGWKTLLKAPAHVIYSLKNSQNVLIFPAHNGLRVYAPLLAALKGLFKGRKLHYVVIGGWLSEFLNGRAGLATALKKFDGIYVETTSMKTALEKMGFDNVYVMPNCKPLTAISENELVYPQGIPYRLCTFSRVTQQKGIEDAVNAVRAVNESFGKTVYTLDIYGPVDAGQSEWFNALQADFPEYISYKGSVDADKSVAVLKDYFALLFPTRFYTEGIPGTLIDAYAAGVPVITSLWVNHADVFIDGMTGWGYEFGNAEELKKLLLKAANQPQKFLSMKKTALAETKKYMPEAAIQNLVQRIV